jgi:hypothetical protein
MDLHDITAPIYRALEITERYFRAAHDNPSKAQQRATEHMITLFNRGERRPLALANRAIAEVERERQTQAVARSSMYDGAA